MLCKAKSNEQDKLYNYNSGLEDRFVYDFFLVPKVSRSNYNSGLSFKSPTLKLKRATQRGG